MSVQPPDISVVIPHLNQPEHLANCLHSVLGQDFDMSRVEIVVVDNGSEVSPERVCAGFPDVRLVNEQTPGPGPARNCGIRVSSAPILAFIDADCIAGQGWLSAILAAFDGDPSTEIVGGDVRIGVRDPDRVTMLEAYESIYAYRQESYIHRQGFSGTGNLAMRRAAYEKVGPFAGIDVAEDREWGRRATAMGYRIRFVPTMVAYHPARTDIGELKQKWARQLTHDFNEQVRGGVDRLRWIAKSLALALSPAWEVLRIARSKRVKTVRERLLALFVLTVLRLYRSQNMLLLLLRPGASHATSWNRGN